VKEQEAEDFMSAQKTGSLNREKKATNGCMDVQSWEGVYTIWQR
jgi:hypothetical protein